MLTLVGPVSAPANASIYLAGFVNGLHVEIAYGVNPCPTEDPLRADLWDRIPCADDAALRSTVG
jgi:hypothetical protein